MNKQNKLTFVYFSKKRINNQKKTIAIKPTDEFGPKNSNPQNWS